MRTQSFLFIIASLFIFSNFATAQSNTEIVKVWGNCGMCKKTIETAAKKAGATNATWDTETKALAVTYNNKKSSLTAIQKAVAAAGYDTKDFTAPDEAYSKLHSCCQYERKDAASSSSVKSECCSGGSCSKSDDCCKKDGTAACCKDGKCEKCKETCSANGACADKNCCKS